MLCEQHLVHRGGNFRNEDAVIMVGIILRFAGFVGMHGMPELVRHGEGIVQRVGEVQKHVGMHAMYAAGECAGGFALVFVNVHPVFGIGFIKQLAIFFAERLERLLYKRLAFFIRDLEFHAFKHRVVQVVHIERIKTQHAFAQLEVLAHGAETGVDGLHKAVVHGDGHIVREQCGFTRALMAAHGSEERVELHGACIHGGEGVDVALELAEVFFKRFAAHALVGAFTVYAEVAVGRCPLHR